MKIDKWVKELRAAGILDENWSIINGFERGFDQGIPETPVKGMKHYCPPNHSSAEDAREEIEKSLREEIKAGRMYGPFSKEEAYEVLGFFRTSPLGAVTNGDGSLRPINDLSFPRRDSYVASVNAHVDKDDFITSWDDFEVVAAFFLSSKGELLLGIFDWAKAYRQIPTLMSQWPFLMILDFTGNVILDTRVTFGGVAGCGVFGKAADAWKKVVLAKLGFTAGFRWVDDTLFIKENNGSNTATMQDVADLSESMGVVTNTKKWREFDFTQKYLGFLWDGKNKTVSIPEEKRKERISQIDKFYLEKAVRFKEVEKLAGRLAHATLVYPQLKCYCMAMYRWMAEWVHKSALRDIPDEVREDLRMWRRTLTEADPRRLIPHKGVRNVAWVGDTSTSYGIGIIIGKKWARFRLRGGWDLKDANGDRREIAWAETVAARLGLLMLSEMVDVRGYEFLMLTDNVVTEAAIKNGKSRNPLVNKEWMKIQKELMRLDCRIKQKRVISEDNAADKLSRGKDSSKKWYDEVRVDLPDDLKPFLVQE